MTPYKPSKTLQKLQKIQKKTYKILRLATFDPPLAALLRSSSSSSSKIEIFEKIENFGDGPGCFGECRGVIPEYFYGIFERF